MPGDGETKDRLRAALETLIEVVLPRRCHFCGAFSGSSGGRGDICPACLNRLTIPPGPGCTVCGRPFVSKAGEDRVCGACRAETPPYAAARYITTHQGAAARAVRALKYARRTELARPLARLMVSAGPRQPWPERFDMVIPVPLHAARLRKRGYNQAWLLARELGCLGRPTPRGLVRTRATRSQVGLNRNQRRSNVRGAFAVSKDLEIKGKSALLIDDVLTTGATVTECARTMKRAGSGPVFVLTLTRLL